MPQTPEINLPMTGREVRRLMRVCGATIRTLAERMTVTQKRVREVRDKGVAGQIFVWEWAEALLEIAGRPDWREAGRRAGMAEAWREWRADRGLLLEARTLEHRRNRSA